ncbi:7751_t:CDS:1, partial [Funneliformis caledonium]
MLFDICEDLPCIIPYMWVNRMSKLTDQDVVYNVCASLDLH